MTPAKFKKIWSGGVFRAPREAASSLKLPNEDLHFLVEAGLPAEVFDFEFAETAEGKFRRLDQYKPRPKLCLPGHHRYRVLGTAFSTVVCLDEQQNGRLVIFDDDDPEPRGLNTGIRALAFSLLAIEEAYLEDDESPDLHGVQKKIATFDPEAVMPGNYWKKDLDRLAETINWMRPEVDTDASVVKHPLLGSLTEAEDRWKGSTTALPGFAACGWNDLQYGELVDYALQLSPKSRKMKSAPKLIVKPPVRKKPKRVDIAIKVKKGKPISAAQEAGIAALVRHEKRILALIANGFDGRIRRGGDWKWMKESLDKEFPTLEKWLQRPEQWLSLIEVSEVVISATTRKGEIVMGCHGSCVWEEEHGFGVRFTSNEVVQVGTADVGWW